LGCITTYRYFLPQLSDKVNNIFLERYYQEGTQVPNSMTTYNSVTKKLKRMLRIRLSITLFHRCLTYELTEKGAVYILESLRKLPEKEDKKRPFVCIIGYNGMTVHILEGSFENFPQYMTIRQGVAYNGTNKNSYWLIKNKKFEPEQLAVFTHHYTFVDTPRFIPTSTSAYNRVEFNDINAMVSYAPAYEPDVWNNDINLLENNNCYTYALNIKNSRKSNSKDPNRNPFGNIIKNCQADGLQIVPEIPLNEDKPLIALFASSPFSETFTRKIDYHFFRRDANGEWSHKNGLSNVTNRDFSGHIIQDILQCDRGRFQHLYCFFKVSTETIQKVTRRI